MGKVRVRLHQTTGFATVEDGATKGATLGVNVYDQNGNLVTSFSQPAGTAAVWGSITGTMSAQTDLQAALDAKGYLNLPKTTMGLEDGKCYSTAAGFTVDTSTEGDICSVYNNSASSITLTQGTGLTLRVAGTATTGNYSLPQRGFVTIWWHTATEAIIL